MMDSEMIAQLLKSAIGKQITITANASDCRGFANLRGRIESVNGFTIVAGCMAGGLHRTWEIQLDKVRRLEVGTCKVDGMLSLSFSAPLNGA